MPEICVLIKETLSVEGRRSSITGIQKPWPLLPLAVAKSISGEYEQVVPAAVAIQLLMAAGDVFDDIEDSDKSDSISSKYGPAIATNVGTTMLILAETALTRIKKELVNEKAILNTIKGINSYFTKACLGQHLDLSIAYSVISENKYLDIVNLKSASQIECCCYTGAALATQNNDVIKLFSVFGRNLGMAAQISNDIMGVVNERDYLKRKINLPVLFALEHADDVSKSILRNFYYSLSSIKENDNKLVKTVLFDSGAIQYASLQLSLYLEFAKETLSELQHLGISTAQLEDFLN